MYTTCMNTHAPHTTGLHFLRPGASPGAEKPSCLASTRGSVFRDRNDLSTENNHLESQDPCPLWSHPSWKALLTPFPQPGGPSPNLLDQPPGPSHGPQGSAPTPGGARTPGPSSSRRGDSWRPGTDGPAASSFPAQHCLPWKLSPAPAHLADCPSPKHLGPAPEPFQWDRGQVSRSGDKELDSPPKHRATFRGVM